MKSPQVVVNLSTQFLTTIIHNVIGLRAACVDLGGQGGPQKDRTFLAGLDVTEVQPLRGDDADSVLKALGKTFGFTTAETWSIKTLADPKGGAVQTDAAFVVATGTARVYGESRLDQVKTSQLDEFLRTASPKQNTALLFRMRATPSADGSGIVLHLAFETILNFNLTLDPNKIVDPQKKQELLDTVAVIKQFRAQLSDIQVPLGNLLGSLTLASSITNVGLAVELPWQDDDGQVQPARGLRIGIDAEPPADATGWQAFAAPAAWDLDTAAGEHWAAFASAPFLESMVKHQAMSALAGVQDAQVGGVTAVWDGTSITARVSMIWQGNNVGDIVLTMTPSFTPKKTGVGPFDFDPIVSIKVCVDFQEDIGDAIKNVLLGIFLGGVIGGVIAGPVALVVGAIIGLLLAIAADIIITVQGKNQAQQGLGGAQLAWACGPMDNQGCRTCQTAIETFVDGVGTLKLSRTVANADGLRFVGVVTKPLASLKPAHLEVLPGGWVYPWGACKPPALDPINNVLLKNTGELPLRICEVAERTLVNDVVAPTKNFLVIKGLNATIEGGGSAAIGVRARITGNQGYDQNAPPPLFIRVLSNGGARVVDLNSPNPAKSQDLQDNVQKGGLAKVMCNALALPAPLWGQITFTDPVRFAVTDHVIERLDFVGQDLGRGALVRATGPGDRVVATGRVVDGSATFSVTLDRRGAATHARPGLSLQGGRVAARTVRGGGRTAAARRGQARNSVGRRLYQEGAWFPFHARILAVLADGHRLAVLTQEGLRLGTVAPGWIELDHARALAAPRGLALYRRQIVVPTGAATYAFGRRLEPAWRLAGEARAVATLGSKLFVADAHGIAEVTVYGRQARRGRRLRLPGVTDLVSAGGSLFALAGRRVWRVAGRRARRLEITGQSLTTVADCPAALSRKGLVVFDRQGRVLTRYASVPWLASVLEWPDVAVEVRRNEGLLVVFAPYETWIDDARLPDGLRTLAAGRSNYRSSSPAPPAGGRGVR